MQFVTILETEQFLELTHTVFDVERPKVFSAYADFGKELEQFRSADEMGARIIRCLNESVPFFSFAVWYPSTGGHVEKERIPTDPAACNGHPFRYAVGGWGLIYLQFDFQTADVECRIVCNSQKRAAAWEAHYPRLGQASAWDWAAVERHALRLISKLESLARQTVQEGRHRRRFLSFDHNKLHTDI